jgi:hypothetical protein
MVGVISQFSTSQFEEGPPEELAPLLTQWLMREDAWKRWLPRLSGTLLRLHLDLPRLSGGDPYSAGGTAPSPDERPLARGHSFGDWSQIRIEGGYGGP